jgi:hypothetical protein
MNFGQLIYWHSFVFGQIYFDTTLYSDNFVFAVNGIQKSSPGGFVIQWAFQLWHISNVFCLGPKMSPHFLYTVSKQHNIETFEFESITSYSLGFECFSFLTMNKSSFNKFELVNMFLKNCHLSTMLKLIQNVLQFISHC